MVQQTIYTSYKEAYLKLLKSIKTIDSDLIVMNYVYSYTDGRKDQVINFSNVNIKKRGDVQWKIYMIKLKNGLNFLKV